LIALPGVNDVIAAGRLDDLHEVAAAIERPLPPLYRNDRGDRMLRVVYLMPRTSAGGGARVLCEHANHLTRFGAEVTVISHFPRPQWFALACAFVEVPFGQSIDLSIPPCDVIVAGYWDQVLPARALGIAPVVHFEQGDFHLYDEVPAELKTLVERSIAAADWTITVGEAAEAALAKRYGVTAHRIMNAVDTDVFYAGPKSSPRRTIVFVGWDGSRFKGIDIARKIADDLSVSHPEVESVWITPNAPVGEAIGRTVVAPSQDELGRIMREATVYVCTSRYESFPLPPLEAMASGTPVVSTANLGICSYARDGENCLMAPVDDTAALLSATRRVLDDEQLARALAVQGSMTTARLEWPVIVDDLLQRFRQLVEMLPPAPARMLEMHVDGLSFVSELDDRRLVALADASPYEHLAIPVSRPIYQEYRLVRWQVVTTKRGGISGIGRTYLPARAEEPIEDSRYQFGIDLLREGFADEAFSWFVGQCQQSAAAFETSLGRWVLLSLIEAGRASDAMDLATIYLAAHPSHPDYYLLLVLAARAAQRPIDVSAAMEAIHALDAGAHFEEWFDAPGELLAHGAPSTVG
jgi:glycosyltransferase involved in cell wall biosynthesis